MMRLPGVAVMDGKIWGMEQAKPAYTPNFLPLPAIPREPIMQ